ncbi:hypothetical protein GCM10028808_40010 [Spirosoma migulaei]
MLNYLKQLVYRLENKLERDVITLLLIMLLATAFVLKIEVVFMELTIQVPLIILGSLLYGGYYYFIVTAANVLSKKIKWKEGQTKISLSVLSMSAIVADVLIHDFSFPIGYVKLWMAVWIVVGAEALVELLAYSKNKGNKTGGNNFAKSNKKNLKVSSTNLHYRQSIRQKTRATKERGPNNGHKPAKVYQLKNKTK